MDQLLSLGPLQHLAVALRRLVTESIVVVQL